MPETSQAGETASSLELAAPFLLTALIIVAGAVLAAMFIIERVRVEYEQILKEAGIPDAQRTVWLQPKNLADMGNWLMDAGGMFAGLSGPLVGAIVFWGEFSPLATVIYWIAILSSFVIFALFVGTVTPRGYPNRPLGFRLGARRVGVPAIWVLTPITVVTASLNLVVGILIWCLGS